MIINYPDMVLKKSSGLNASETYLSKLCEKTFLTLWSYPNCYRDQGRKLLNDGQKIGDGKELCDLLAVFDNHIFIFSDKDCKFPDIKDIRVAWSRWYRSAIDEAAKQLLGAERWLFRYPDKVYIDKECTRLFPLPIPNKENSKVHRIVISHGTSAKCQEYFNSKSGSLIQNNSIIGKQHFDLDNQNLRPFEVGIVNTTDEFIHVIDDFSLAIVMSSVDTVSDFIDYLDARERFLSGNIRVNVAGEEELMALYLTSSDENGRKSFEVYYDRDNYENIIVSSGTWDDFIRSDLKQRLDAANYSSYLWDYIISKFLFNITNGTSEHLSPSSLPEQEKIFRVMARENRLRRRLLSELLIDLIRGLNPSYLTRRTIMPNSANEPAYFFMFMPSFPNIPDSVYRERRLELLQDYLCLLVKKNPTLTQIIGLATDSKTYFDNEDVVYIDTAIWSEADFQYSDQVESKLADCELLSERVNLEWSVTEFPLVIKEKLTAISRNSLCPCGSGKKYKKCCGKSVI